MHTLPPRDPIDEFIATQDFLNTGLPSLDWKTRQLRDIIGEVLEWNPIQDWSDNILGPVRKILEQVSHDPGVQSKTPSWVFEILGTPVPKENQESSPSSSNMAPQKDWRRLLLEFTKF